MPDSLAVRLAKAAALDGSTSVDGGPGVHRSSSTLTRVNQVLDSFAARDRTGKTLTAVRHYPAREAQWAEFPAWAHGDLRAAYNAKGIRQLYTHQTAAAEAVHAGKNVVIVTPTASGKTLYNLPVLDAILADGDTRAMYLFPTKALAQDQLAELYDLNLRLDQISPDGLDVAAGGNARLAQEASRFGVFTYDGDTPGDARKAIREKSHIVLTNPDMLHTGILPHHTRWTQLFENLRYIVLDELHTYRGVFGSHLCNVLRRLSVSPRFTAASRNSYAARRQLPIPANWLPACRGGCRGARVERFALRGKNICVLQPAGGEPRPGNTPQLHK